MKKLMIAAAAAAMVGGVFAACDITPAANCAEVYDVVFNLKTTECKCTLTKTIIRSACDIDTQRSCDAWRQVVSKKVQGVIFSCFCDCTADVNGSVLDSNVFAPVIWNGKTGEEMEGNQYFWIAKDKIVLPAEDLLTIKWLARIGKNKTQVEAAGTFGDGINVAGYGVYDASHKRVKSISGYAAGVWGADIDCAQEGEERCPAYQLCDPTEVMEDISKTFVGGTWSVKYNAAKSKAIMANGAALWGKVVPKAVANYDLATWYGSASL